MNVAVDKMLQQIGLQNMQIMTLQEWLQERDQRIRHLEDQLAAANKQVEEAQNNGFCGDAPVPGTGADFDDARTE